MGEVDELVKLLREEQAGAKRHLRRSLAIHGITLADLYAVDPLAGSVIGPQEPGDDQLPDGASHGR